MLPSEFLAEYIDAIPSRPLGAEPAFGRDISCKGEVDPGFAMVEGDERLRQLILRIVTTAPYSMFGDPDFSIDLSEFLHTRLTGTEIGSRISGRVKRHPYFDGCEVTVTSIPKGLHFKIAATPVGNRNPIVVETTVRAA
ncbi:MAG: hypothetical protein ACOYBP_08955 [Microbacteriaceae bacterium]